MGRKTWKTGPLQYFQMVWGICHEVDDWECLSLSSPCNSSVVVSAPRENKHKGIFSSSNVDKFVAGIMSFTLSQIRLKSSSERQMVVLPLDWFRSLLSLDQCFKMLNCQKNLNYSSVFSESWIIATEFYCNKLYSFAQSCNPHTFRTCGLWLCCRHKICWHVNYVRSQNISLDRIHVQVQVCCITLEYGERKCMQ